MFNTESLTTIQQCDEIIAFAEEEIDDLQFMQTSAARQQNRTADQSAEVAEDLQAAQAEVDAYTASSQVLPEGPAKKENAKKLRRAIYTKENLLELQGKNNPVAVLRRALQVQSLGAQLVVFQTLVSEVTARKAALAGT